MIPEHLSASQIQTYLSCPAKYRFRYFEKAEPQFRPSAMAFGSAIHATLDWLHKKWQEGEQPSWEEIARTFQADWASEWVEDGLLYPPGSSAESLGGLGSRLLVTYLDETPPMQPRASELSFEVDFIHPQTGEILEVPLRGYIDMVAEDGTVVELKVYSRKPDATALALNVQLSAYSYAMSQIKGKRPKLRMDCLLKTKTPRLERIPIERGEDDDVRLFVLAQEVLKAVRAEVFPPRPDWPCRDCEYRYLCPAWNF
jgi:putative RecB family exonuclease